MLYISKIIKHRTFSQISSIRFANIMNNTTVVNTFNSKQNRYIMATITYRVLNFEPMIKVLIVTSIPSCKSIIL